MKKLLFIFLLLLGFGVSDAQTKEELQALKKEKNDSIDALKAKADDIQGQIDAVFQDSTTGTPRNLPIPQLVISELTSTPLPILLKINIFGRMLPM